MRPDPTLALAEPCPRCKAKPGQPCKGGKLGRDLVHMPRRHRAATKRQEQLAGRG
jgi:hypothetical protein